jgi:hypothetical protein
MGTERRRGVHGRQAYSRVERLWQVPPVVVQCGAGLLRSPPFSLAARLPLESHLAREHVRDGTRSLVGQYGQGCAFGMFCLQAGEVWLRRQMVSQEHDGGFRTGPLQVGVADLGA